jgi:hypothetical protein
MRTDFGSKRLLLLLCVMFMLGLASCGGGGGSSTGGGGGGGGTPLTITTTTLPDGVVGVEYDQTITSSGGKSPITWSYGGFFPGGLTLSSGGRITGTVTGAVFGDVTFQARDANGQTAQATIRMTFHWKLSIFTTTLPLPHINAMYDALIQSDGPVDASTWKITGGSLPSGLQLANPTSSQIELTGMPTQTGTYNFTLQVQDTSNPVQVAQQTYSAVVDSTLTITTAALNDGVSGLPYSTSLAAVNGTPPYHWSANSLPTGLSIDPNLGTISGTTAYQGNYQTTITVTDSASPANTTSQSYNMQFVAKLSLYGTMPDGYLNQNYFSNLYYNGGKYPLAWSVVSGSLPPGIKLTNPQYGGFTGTPTQIGSYSFTVQASDSSFPPQTAQLPLTMNVKPPVLSMPFSLPNRLPLNVPFSGIAAATGGIPPYTWALTAGTLPTGLSLNTSTGEVSGAPTLLGSYNFTITVTDSAPTPQTAWLVSTIAVTEPLGRNDTVAKATPLGNGSYYASLSPYADPPDLASPVPDTDYYKIIGSAGNVVQINVNAQGAGIDPVLEIVDINGMRLNACRQPRDVSTTFNSQCMNDDIQSGVQRNSQLELKVPGSTGTQATFYAHVVDWRGDARPDFTYYIVITGAVDPLSINTAALPPCWNGRTCYDQFYAYGGTAPVTFSIASGSFPPGLTLNADGSLAGTPTTNGSYSFQVKATDSGSPAQTPTASFTLNIIDPAVITTTSLPNAQTGVAYSQQLTVTGGTPPYYWLDTNSCGTPPCLTLGVAYNGILQGTAKYPGSYTVKARISDGYGMYSGTSSIPITIIPGPLYTAPLTLYGQVSHGFVTSIDTSPSGGTPPYTYAVQSGSLPPGITLTNSPYPGYLSGMPTTAGTYVGTILVADSGSPVQTTTMQVTITINP